MTENRSILEPLDPEVAGTPLAGVLADLRAAYLAPLDEDVAARQLAVLLAVAGVEPACSPAGNR